MNQLPPFELLFEQYKEKIFRLVYRMTGDDEESRDLTQEVFLSAYRSYKKFRQEANFYSYLYRIAVNTTINHLKKKKKTVSLDERANKLFDLRNNPHRLLEQEETRRLIRKAVNSLSSKYRDVIILKEIEGLAYVEIAKILEISIETVGARLVRAREKLRKKLRRMKDEMR